MNRNCRTRTIEPGFISKEINPWTSDVRGEEVISVVALFDGSIGVSRGQGVIDVCIASFGLFFFRLPVDGVYVFGDTASCMTTGSVVTKTFTMSFL